MEVTQEECQVKVGVFSYVDRQGTAMTVEFMITTCPDDQSKRVSDYNEQLSEEWDRLLQEGFTRVIFTELTPSPIF